MPLPRKPLLPRHYTLWFDPPDDDGDETLHVLSERRAIRLKGQAFREFTRSVAPLLDGEHSLEEIEVALDGTFRSEDLRSCLGVLHAQGLVVEGDHHSLKGGVAARLAPQLNLFHDLAPDQDLQARLQSATVAVLGLGGAGTAVALSLAAAGIGTLRCVDSGVIANTDRYFSPALGDRPDGQLRASAVAGLLRSAAPETRVTEHGGTLVTEEHLRSVISGSHYVVCCLDAAQSNLIYKLNRVCLADAIPWITCSPAGAEVTVGPAFQPPAGACYMCYRMRLVACAGNPEDAFAHERLLDRRQRDDGGVRESLVFSTNLAAQLVGLEVMKSLTQVAEPSLVGRILTIRLTDLHIERHTILRKPWCPACGTTGQGHVS